MAKRAVAESGIEVVVTGDLFYERFLWPNPPATSDGRRTLPYTTPDELREARTTSTIAVLSGAAMHAQIIKAYLTMRNNRRKGKETFVVQPPSIDKSKCPPILGENATSPEPLSTALHELGPFPVVDSRDRRSDPRVWRIARSFGIVVQANGNPPHALDVQNRRLLLDAAKPIFKLLAAPSVDKPTVVVINDRDLGFRDTFASKESREAFSKIATNVQNPNLLILWHVRHPLFTRSDGDSTETPLAQVLCNNPGLSGCTIPLLSHHCLRDEGLSLRFDCSYEQTLRSLLRSLEHPLMLKLLRFPHTLIRFDYGILHLSAKDGQLINLDVHALNAGPYHFSISRHGVMTGRTPLLAAAIAGEIVEHFDRNPGASLQSFLTDSLEQTAPTLLQNTLLDRAIDMGMLLSSLNNHMGLGEFNRYESFSLPNGTGPVYEQLVKDFWDRIETEEYCRQVSAISENTEGEAKRDTGSAKSADQKYSALSYRHELIGFDRLSRLSVPRSLLRRGPSVPTLRESFSRVDLLAEKIVFLGGPLQSQQPFQRDVAPFDLVLRSIVRFGLDRVVTRDSGGDGARGYIHEPSIFCPFVTFGSHLSSDSAEIDSFLSLRYLVEKYVSQADWNRPLAIAIFGPPGSGKGYLVKQVLESVPFCNFDETITCNLTQLLNPSELARYFHRVQDRALKGEVPIVFFGFNAK